MDAGEMNNPYLKYEFQDVIRLLQSFLRQLNFQLEHPKAPGRIVRGGSEGVGEILLLKQRQKAAGSLIAHKMSKIVTRLTKHINFS
jgi:hypothetical protein